MATITHPDIPGSEVDVPDSSLPFHQAAGWVVKGSEDDPEVKAAAEKGETADGGKDAQPDSSKETPKGRRASTKDGD
ncbi:hypothetical protein [Microbispora sp. KK1-11]|uniref:hypothetical protein n=1 Tax=Microbispora sp. KK1-11 TaxID=2053005 RepID=UPI00115B3245|nr:hypothetical protein [Microbispora sp. KK1-11]TQS29129.1 hypothetical protein FLW16_12345 [Microbispora sp. KK1-11]